MPMDPQIDRQSRDGPEAAPMGRDPNARRRGWWLAGMQIAMAFALISATVALYSLHQLDALRNEIESGFRTAHERYLALDAQARYDTTRRQLRLALRREIERARPDLDEGKARNYAEWIVRAVEKYPDIDSAMLVSIGIVESRYDARAESTAGARGLYQILPSTGRRLAQSLGWEYSDEMLYDARANTELAAFYLTLLSASYDDVGVVLAEYNGGPRNAAYYRSGSSALADETREYVPKVLDIYARITSNLPVVQNAGTTQRGVDHRKRMAARHGLGDSRDVSAIDD